MNQTLAHINARRAWYVPVVSIWGDLAALTIPALVTEFDDAATRVVLYEFALGGEVQEIPYAALIDHRGNTLPPVIAKPVVVIIPRNATSVALIGQPTGTACRLAKTVSDPADALVDLWITEAGD